MTPTEVSSVSNEPGPSSFSSSLRSRNVVWTVEDVQRLLTDYLTEPEFATVALMPDGRMSVTLPADRGAFWIQITAG